MIDTKNKMYSFTAFINRRIEFFDVETFKFCTRYEAAVAWFEGRSPLIRLESLSKIELALIGIVDDRKEKNDSNKK